jgi:uncharacterized phage protein gp47/JayE
VEAEKWGLTEWGFYRPTNVQILNALEYKGRELFGEKVNLTIRSPLGIILRILSYVIDMLFAALENVYNSRYADTAVGTSLYNLGRNIGLTLLPAGKARGYITITGEPGTIVRTGYLVGTPGGLHYTVMQECSIGTDGKVLALIQAVEAGKEYNTEAGTVTSIVNPESIQGIESIYNEAAIENGRERETDAEYRERYYASVDYAGGVNSDSIRAALMQEVDGLHTAYVYENDSDVRDEEYGLPPHSIEAVVYGGLDEDIARVIYKEKAAGIQTVGSSEIQILSKSDQKIGIHFSRAELVEIYIKITGLKTDDKFEGNDEIICALMEYVGSDALGGLSIGKDVIYISLPGVIMDVAGVVDFDVYIGKTAETTQKENISIGIREKAFTGKEMVIFN